MTGAGLAAVVLVLVPVVVSPGASLTLALNELLRGDARAPLRVGIGTALGVVLLGVVVAATGVPSLIARDDRLTRLLAVIGAVVLLWLAVSAWRAAGASPSTSGRPTRSVVTSSYLMVVSNPKALSVYLVVAPSVLSVPTATGYLTFAATHALLVLGWLTLIGRLSARLLERRDLTVWRGRLLRAGAVWLAVLAAVTAAGA
ncbi:LysE family translocator [Luteipulveratus halotolerans]|uniref:Lysine transporter LysE n=1 Tax=Luteipulveratus halotolerans TaxID=1631356 RepID=A0A0L6CEF6_9MICO|nr:LysE family transporter [Luteipulveratus halotolerans]KNX36261.1 hypothetical protein VV01_02475 [Luteipulveratus halotolerans]